MIRSFSKRRALSAKPPPLGFRDQGSLLTPTTQLTGSLFYAGPHFSAISLLSRRYNHLIGQQSVELQGDRATVRQLQDQSRVG